MSEIEDYECSDCEKRAQGENNGEPKCEDHLEIKEGSGSDE